MEAYEVKYAIMDGDIRALYPPNYVKPPMQKFELTLLPNGLPTCEIQIINPFNSNESITIDALIDSGTEISMLCSSVFEKFTIHEEEKEVMGLSTTVGLEMAFKYPMYVKLPSNNWASKSIKILVKDMSMRSEYKALIGVDVLKSFVFTYNGTQNGAFLMY